MIYHRRLKNPTDHMVKSKLRDIEDVVAGIVKCKVSSKNTFRSCVCARASCLNHHFNRDSLGEVYLITCKKCE